MIKIFKTKLLINFVLLISISFTSMYSLSADNFTIYLTRHAEKSSEMKNPTLTECGTARAKLLAKMLSKAKIQAIYSTSYQRTLQTAKPLANLHKMPIKNYNPKHLEQLAMHLKRNKTNTLVVGHSNTTPQLASLLSKQQVPPLTEQDYQYLYQIQFIGNESMLTVFQQPLECKH